MPGIAFSDFAQIEPAPSWRFQVDFPVLPVSSADSNAQVPSLQGNVSSLSLLVQNVVLIQKSTQSEQVPFNSGSRNFPTQYANENLQVTFCETDRYVVTAFYARWRKLIIKDNGNFGLPKDYWKRIVATPLDTTGVKRVEFGYEECFPLSMDGMQYDGAQTSHIQPSIVFAVNTPIDPKILAS